MVLYSWTFTFWSNGHLQFNFRTLFKDKIIPELAKESSNSLILAMRTEFLLRSALSRSPSRCEFVADSDPVEAMLSRATFWVRSFEIWRVLISTFLFSSSNRLSYFFNFSSTWKDVLLLLHELKKWIIDLFHQLLFIIASFLEFE